MLPARKFFGQNFMPDFFNDLFDNVSLENKGFKAPAINVIEDDNKYCIELAAPGMAKDDFKVHVNKDGNLVIEMEKKEKEEKNECEEGKCCEAKNVRYIRREFSCSKFRQTLLLPENAERDEIKARVENGILHICIPKMVKPKTEEEKREIEIH